jgi:hypothetical protein
VTMNMEPATIGLLGGSRVVGTSVGGVFAFEALLDPPDESGNRTQHVRFSLNDLTGLAPVDALRELEFVAALCAPNRVAVLPEYGPAPDGTVMPIEFDEPMITAQLVQFVAALATLQEKRNGKLRTPDLNAQTWGEIKPILQAAALVDGFGVVDSWTDWPDPIEYPMRPDSSESQEVSLTVTCSVEIAGETIDIGEVRVLLAAADLSWDPSEGAGPVKVTARAAASDDRIFYFPMPAEATGIR